MNNFLNFTTGMLTTFGATQIVDESTLNQAQILISKSIDPAQGLTNWEQIINSLIAIFGGILSTIIINILRSKFPELFKQLKKRKSRRIQSEKEV